jgi:hypothetical protein
MRIGIGRVGSIQVFVAVQMNSSPCPPLPL